MWYNLALLQVCDLIKGGTLDLQHCQLSSLLEYAGLDVSLALDPESIGHFGSTESSNLHTLDSQAGEVYF